jgi:lipopolysaccharide/colanic/teichoic acid biosynthesis glycosyltransferase
MLKKLVTEKSGESIYDFLARYVDLKKPDVCLVATTDEFNIANRRENFSAIANLSRVNDIRYINKFFISVNSKLINEGLFVCCFETITSRQRKTWFGKVPVLKSILFSFEFLFLRVAPKIWGLKKIYFAITKGRNRLLSKAEVLGRLVYCGFEILVYEPHNSLTYVICKKIKEPDENPNPSYGPLFKMKRMGKNGSIIGVYKFRTMHPYAEYLQSYILQLNGYSDTGKPANDFRLTPWGGFLRRYWLDELPQLFNILKGEMKLVGVRPVTERYFQDIPKDLQELRLQQKPGCIPPYVALNRKGSVGDVLQAEREYLIEKSKRPYSTDIRYFFNALFNIIFRRKRSA